MPNPLHIGPLMAVALCGLMTFAPPLQAETLSKPNFSAKTVDTPVASAKPDVALTITAATAARPTFAGISKIAEDIYVASNPAEVITAPAAPSKVVTATPSVPVFSVQVISAPVEANPVDPAPAEKIADALANQLPILIYDIHFDFDKAIIKPGTQPSLELIAKVMRDDPDLEIVIEGHTDDMGPADHNQILSQDRADAVKQVLIGRFGIAPDRMVAVGMGMSHPAVPNATEAGREVNRRVEIHRK